MQQCEYKTMRSLIYIYGSRTSFASYTVANNFLTVTKMKQGPNRPPFVLLSLFSHRPQRDPFFFEFYI